ncbi:MAG: excisionase family DNA-binding protein [Acidimicrobiales bacterium]
MEPIPTDRDLLTTSEVARTLGVQRSYLNQLIHTGVIPATRIGQLWFIHRQDVPASLRIHSYPRVGRYYDETLRWLAGHEGETVRETADGLGISRRAALQRLQNLEAADLIYRVPGKSPRHPHHTYLTPEGHARLDEAAA